MKFIIFATLLALAIAQPRRDDSSEQVKVIRDERHHDDDGSFSTDFESEDGIVISQSGGRLEYLKDTPIGSQGTVEFTFPTGEKYFLKYVANENGFQPESPFLPVAPEFPHPIPQFVLDQIAKAAIEDAEDNSYEN